MELMNYRDCLKAGKDKIKEALVPVRFNRAKQKAKLKMCELDEKIAIQTADIHELCASDDLDFDKIIDKQDDLAMLTRRKEQYQKILDEMFPTKEDS